MTLTIPQQHGQASLAANPSRSPSSATTRSCPNCGHHATQQSSATTPTAPSRSASSPADAEAELVEARQRIADLEAQVVQLNQKAAAAIDRWADYEDELSRLRAQSPTFTHPSTVSSPLSPKDQQQYQNQVVQSPHQQQQESSPTRIGGGFNRLSALLAPRKSTPNLRTGNLVVPAAGGTTHPLPPLAMAVAEVEELRQALRRETGLRQSAEARLSKTTDEVEELSAALFEQANEMVAGERRARAALEDRVGELERRDAGRRRRLDRLEGAVSRLRRARAVLDADGLVEGKDLPVFETAAVSVDDDYDAETVGIEREEAREVR